MHLGLTSARRVHPLFSAVPDGPARSRPWKRLLARCLHLALTLALLCGPAGGQGVPPDLNRRAGQPAGPRLAPEGPVQEIIRSKVQLCKEEPIRALGTALAYSKVLAGFYDNRGYAPAWSEPKNVEEMVQAIRGAAADGLVPEDYHLLAIETLRPQGQGQASPELAADLDLFLSDALLRLSHHLLYGKVNPLSLFPDWNPNHANSRVDLAKAVQEALNSGQLNYFLEGLRPKNPYYLELKQALADYRAIAARGGWRLIPPGPNLKEGRQDRRASLLRQRLAISGDLDAASAAKPGPVFDETLMQAVRHFQGRHGLKADGVVDPATLEALNVPVEQRIDQIRVNLERARWVLRDPPGPTRVLVNIAAFSLEFTGAGEKPWKTRVVVGQPYLKTPVVESKIETIIFNPTWTVPQSIAETEILPKLAKNPGYLGKHNYRLVSSDPLRIVQDPGPKNALGRVKFLFPNKYDIYLHDTPNRELFREATRTFSHGCIRVENALHLAELLLNDPEWTPERIKRVVNSRQTLPVDLETPVPVGVVYRTVEISPAGEIGFVPDIYQRDFAVLSALQRRPQAE